MNSEKLRLRGFQKPQLQSISIFFKFVHVLPVVFTLLFIASFDVFRAGYFFFVSLNFALHSSLNDTFHFSCLMIPFYLFKPKSLHLKGGIKELIVASLRTQTYIRSWLLFIRKVKKRPPELRKSKHLKMKACYHGNSPLIQVGQVDLRNSKTLQALIKMRTDNHMFGRNQVARRL